MKMILLTEGETMSRLFDLDWQLLADSCLMIIAIFVLFLALSYFLFNPARKFLNDRKEKIRGELEEAKTSQNLDRLEELSRELRAEIHAFEDNLGALIDTERNFPEAALAVRKLRFLEKLEEEISDAIEQVMF